MEGVKIFKDFLGQEFLEKLQHDKGNIIWDTHTYIFKEIKGKITIASDC